MYMHLYIPKSIFCNNMWPISQLFLGVICVLIICIYAYVTLVNKILLLLKLLLLQ